MLLQPCRLNVAWSAPGADERLKAYYPLGINEPSDVAEAIELLLRSPNITGQTFVMDSGFSSIRV